jgi:hypothetical protein
MIIELLVIHPPAHEPNDTERVIIITKGNHICEGIYVKNMKQYIIACTVLNPDEVKGWFYKQDIIEKI